MAPSMRYLVVRALLFLLPFAVLMIAQVPWWLSLIVALAFAFAASIVFFPKLRDEAAADLQRMREGRKRDGAGPDDADIEDAVLDEPADDRIDEPAAEADADAEADDGAATAADADAATSADADAATPGAPDHDATDERDEPGASARP